MFVSQGYDAATAATKAHGAWHTDRASAGQDAQLRKQFLDYVADRGLSGPAAFCDAAAETRRRQTARVGLPCYTQTPERKYKNLLKPG